jgi:hypothetical protein
MDGFYGIQAKMGNFAGRPSPYKYKHGGTENTEEISPLSRGKQYIMPFSVLNNYRCAGGGGAVCFGEFKRIK